MEIVNTKMDMSRENKKSSENLSTCGDRLVFLLEKIGITRSRLADDSGVVVTTISKYCESDALPGSKVLEVLVRKYRVRVEWLLGMDSRIFSGESVRESSLHEEASLNYERECLRLKNQLAEMAISKADIAQKSAENTAKMASMQNEIVTAMGHVADYLGLDMNAKHTLQAAVMDYASWQVAPTQKQGGYNKAPGTDVIQYGIPDWPENE